jgi:transposase
MGADPTAASVGLAARSPTRNGTAIGRERDPVYGIHGLPVAAIAERVSAVFDGARLFLCLVAHRRVRQHQSPSGHGGAREGGTRSKPDRRRHRQPIGEDAGKKIKGRKRHIVTDTQGNLVGLVVHEADVQDRDGAPRVLASIRSLYPWLRHVFADGGYAGDKLRAALKGKGSWTLEIIKRSDRAKGFEILPRRWVVERTFAWLGRCRRLAKDFEASITSAVAWVLVAHIRTITRRIARH